MLHRALLGCLARNRSVFSLNLSYNGLSPVAGALIAAALLTNTTLATLRLDHNELGSECAVSLAKAIKVNSTLKSLDLGSIEAANGSGLGAIANSLSHNKSLTFLDLGFNDRDGFAMSTAVAIRQNHTLTDLRLFDVKLGPNGAAALGEALATNTALRALDLGLSCSGDDLVPICKGLSINTSLTRLDLSHCSNLSAASLVALELALKQNSTLIHLVSPLPGGAAAETAPFANAIASNVGLVELDLSSLLDSNSQLLPIFIAIASHPTISKLKMKKTGCTADAVVAFAQLLKSNTSLRDLDLSENDLRDSGVGMLAEALKKNTTLLKLNLRNTAASGPGILSLASAIEVNSTLTHLIVNFEDVRGNSVSCWPTFMRSLALNQSLRTLTLPGVAQFCPAWSDLEQVLIKNETLLDLEVSESRPDPLIRFSPSIGPGSRLRSLNLSHHRFPRTHVKWTENLGAALLVNKTLTELRLRGTTLRDASIEPIAAALHVNSTLLRLDLSENYGVSNHTAHLFAKVFETNCTLEVLDLSACESINDVGGRYLFDAAKIFGVVKVLGTRLAKRKGVQSK